MLVQLIPYANDNNNIGQKEEQEKSNQSPESNKQYSQLEMGGDDPTNNV